MASNAPKITICIPHWQVQNYLTICLRSIRKHTPDNDVEVLVVDNGSRDESIEYLRSLDWIRLIERPGESPDNWPLNFFTALDCGLEQAAGDFFVTMHTDVFVKRDDWLAPFLRELHRSPRVGAAGAWKLTLEHPLYALQKRVFGYATYKFKRTLGGRKRNVRWKQGHYPRDYCAMYRRNVIVDNGLTFRPINGWSGGGHSIAEQVRAAGYEMGMFSVREMYDKLAHVTHGTAATEFGRPLNHGRAQKKAERRAAELFTQDWVLALLADDSLDRLPAAA